MIALSLSKRDAQAVSQALELLAVLAPEHHDHFCREITEVTYSRSACGTRDALACTGAHLHRRVVLAVPPSRMDLIELAVVLSHESRHHFTDAWGNHYQIAHTCSDCSNPYERALDAIYIEDDQLRAHLLANLIPIAPARPLSAAYQLGVAAALVGFGLAVASRA